LLFPSLGPKTHFHIHITPTYNNKVYILILFCGQREEYDFEEKCSMHVGCKNELNPSAEVTPYRPCEIYVKNDLREVGYGLD